MSPVTHTQTITRASGKIQQVLALACLCVVPTLLIYFPGLHGPFVFDDWSNFVNDHSIRIGSLSAAELRSAAFGSSSELLLRPLARISFALNYLVAGETMSSFAFKSINLAIHVINTFLVFWFTKLLLCATNRDSSRIGSLEASWAPIAVACIWAIHPLQLTSVLYVVQRMTTLSAMCVFAGLIAFVHGRLLVYSEPQRGLALMVGAPAAALVAGIGFKENAAILPLFLVLIEFTLLERRHLNSRIRQHLSVFYCLCAVGPLLFAGFLLYSGTLAGTYAGRGFGLGERLLTETRVLWHYAGMLIAPTLDKLSLFHDDISISTGIFTPWTTAPAAALHVVVFATSILLRNRFPVCSFSVLWFYIGHCVESGPIGLEIAHEHRNYVPAFGPLFGTVYFAFKLGQVQRWRAALVTISIATLLLLAYQTFSRARIWATEDTLIQDMVTRHPASARSQHMMGELLARRHRDQAAALNHYRCAAALAPAETAYRIRIAAILAIPTSSVAHPKMQSVAAIAAEPSPPLPATTASSCPAAKQPPDLGDDRHNLDSIAAALSRNPLSADTITALRDLGNCIDTTTAGCVPLQPLLLEWLRAALLNNALPAAVRNDFTVFLFNLGVARKDYATALWAARRGLDRDSTNPTYLLMAANAYILQNDLDGAEVLLRDFDVKYPGASDELSFSRSALHAMITTRRLKSSPH